MSAGLARYDPCGHAVDMVRRPYRTKVRPFRDSEDELDLHWYPVPEGTPTLPYPSLISSLDWSPDPWEVEGVGEVYGEPRKFDGWGRLFLSPPGGIHGTRQDFEEGGLKDSSAPPLARNPDGLPVECAGADDGMLMGGTSRIATFGEMLLETMPVSTWNRQGRGLCTGASWLLDVPYLFVRESSGGSPSLPFWSPLQPGVYRMWYWSVLVGPTDFGATRVQNACPSTFVNFGPGLAGASGVVDITVPYSPGMIGVLITWGGFTATRIATIMLSRIS